ncbi:MAG TPA: nuclear transport factor 2 family protein [Trebonia sp.]|nr:nuclear transport factor 2 family protein [Trebonia sp.]
MNPEQTVRKFFDCYTNGRPEDFDQYVAPDYVDYGHNPPGIGPAGARDDYEQAVSMAGGLISYEIDALVPDGEMVAATWTGTMPGDATLRGLSIFQVSDGLVRSTRHALIGDAPG